MAYTQKKDREKKGSARNAAVSAAQTENVNRYGSAVKEHVVAYSGTDNETGQVLKKGLKSISNEKISNTQPNTSIKSQAGYAAEVKTAARENAENIINGKNTKVSRTDDLPKDLKSGSGQPVGGVNNELYDLVEISQDGSYIEGSARQLKYVGKDPKDCCDKLLQKKFDKYRDADAKIEIPKDYFDGVKAELEDKIEKTKIQIKNAEGGGKPELVKKLNDKLKRLEKTKTNLRKGKLTTAEAVEARLHPKISTAKDIAKISNRSGLEGAKSGAVIGGGMSFIQHTVAVIKGDEEVGDAVIGVAGDTAKAAGVGYATGFLGSAIKGGMQNASSSFVQTLSKTSLPAMIGTSVLEVGKTLYRFAAGEIDMAECLTELGEKGSNITASTFGATIGQILIPIPILGGLIGGMVGYFLSSTYYNQLTSALNEAKAAREERIRIEAECEKAIEAIREYRFEMEVVIRNYLERYTAAFEEGFSQIQNGFKTGKVDLVIQGANHITETLGQKPVCRSVEELDVIMKSKEVIII